MRSQSFPLNARFLAVLLLLGAVAGVGVFFLHRYQVQRFADIFLEQARRERDKIAEQKSPADKLAQLKTAWENYDQYARLVPEDLEARTECALMLAEAGKSLAEAGQMLDATWVFSEGVSRAESILFLDNDRRDLRRELVNLRFYTGDWPATIANIKLLCQEPANAEALRAFLDREGLWDRLQAPAGEPDGDARGLASLLESDGNTVDRGKLLEFLGTEFWRLLTDSELLRIYATCQINLDRPQLAEKPLERAITLVKSNLDTYALLARLLADQRRFDDADYWMNEMLLANPDAFRARQVRASYRLRRLQARDAAELDTLARAALADAIGSIRMAVEQALEEADRTAPSAPATEALKEACRRAAAAAPENPADPGTPEFHAGLLEAARKAAAMRNTSPQIDERVEGICEGLSLAAQASAELEQIAKTTGTRPLTSSVAFATTAVELFPSSPDAYIILAELAVRAGRANEAIDWLRKGRKQAQQNQFVLWRLARLLLNTGKSEEATDVVDELKAAGKAGPFVDELQARIDCSEGKWLAAAERFERVLPELIEGPAEVREASAMLATCYGNLGRFEDQRKAFLQATSADRSWLPALRGLARSKAASGQIEEAIEDYRLVVKHESALPTDRIELARLLLVRNLRRAKSDRDWREIEELLSEIEAAGGAIDALVLRAEILLAEGKNDETTVMLKGALTQIEKSLRETTTKRGELLAEAERLDGDQKSKKLGEAAQLAAKIDAHKGAILSVRQLLAAAAQRREDWPEVEATLAAAQQELGDTPALRVARGRYLFERYGAEASAKLRELAENTDSFDPRNRVWLWQTLATLSAGAGDDEQVERLCQRVLEAEPGNLNAYRLLFQSALRRRDAAGMADVLAKIKRVEKTPSAFWYYGEAARLLQLAVEKQDKAMLQNSLASVTQAIRMEPQVDRYHLLAAELHERLGDLDAAADQYIAAVDAGVYSPQVIQRVTQLLARQGRFREADRLFRLVADAQGELSDTMGRQALSVKARLGEFEDALAVARKVAQESRDFADHISLGQLLTIVAKQADSRGKTAEAKKLFEEAEAAFKEAVRCKMDEPQTWVALIQFYSQTGKTESAESALAQAERRLPSREATGALAECYEALGKPAKAAEQFALALRNAPHNVDVVRRAAEFYLRTGRTEEAEVQLRRIADGDLEANEAQRAWARRTLAFGLFARGGAKERDAALAWIEQNLKADPNSIEDQSAKAIMLASDASGGRRLEAIRIFEEFLATRPHVPPEAQFLLAKLQLAEDRFGRYKTLMRDLLRDHAGEPRYVMHFAEALMLRGELEEAKTWVDQLASQSPDAFQTARLRAEYAFRQNQWQSVLGIIREWAGAGDTRKKRLPAAAALAESFAKRLRKTDRADSAMPLTEEAQKLFQEYVDLEPGRELLMAEFLAGQERVEEAIQTLEKAWPGAPPLLIAQAAFAIVGSAGTSPEQLIRVDKILHQALEELSGTGRADAAVPLRIIQAAIRDRQSRFDEAERIYRDILKEDPTSSVAMNALAVLLAQEGVRLDEAQQLIDRAIALTEGGANPALLDSRATVLLALGQPEQALADLNRAIQEEPNALRLFHQAQAYHALGKKKPAVDALRRAHELGLEEGKLPSRERPVYHRLKILLR